MYDTKGHKRTRQDIMQEREANAPMRDRIPLLSQQVTVASYLDTTDMGKCMFVPVLDFGGKKESKPNEDKETKRRRNLATFEQESFGRKQGRGAKAVLNMETEDLAYTRWKHVVNTRNPNRHMCGFIEDPGADYIASLLRIQRYAVGPLESYLETHFELHALEEYQRIQFDAQGNDTSIQPWLHWFTHKVGPKVAMKLLWHPLRKNVWEVEGLRKKAEHQWKVTEHLANVGKGA